MTAVETIPKATVWAALEALGIPAGEPFNRTMVVHITGDHISYEQADGQTILWRRVVDECPSCHAAQGQPHTDYCQGRRHGCEDPDCRRCPDCNQTACRCPVTQSGRVDGWPGTTSLDDIIQADLAAAGSPEQRPKDDPADEITCDGRNCGGRPHT